MITHGHCCTSTHKRRSLNRATALPRRNACKMQKEVARATSHHLPTTRQPHPSRGARRAGPKIHPNTRTALRVELAPPGIRLHGLVFRPPVRRRFRLCPVRRVLSLEACQGIACLLSAVLLPPPRNKNLPSSDAFKLFAVRLGTLEFGLRVPSPGLASRRS